MSVQFDTYVIPIAGNSKYLKNMVDVFVHTQLQGNKVG